MDRFRRRSLRLLAATSFAVVLSTLSPPARAELEVGADAPDVKAREYLNTEPLALQDLRGRLVFLELFSTT